MIGKWHAVLEFLHELDRELKMGKVWVSLDSTEGTKIASITFKWYPDKTHTITQALSERELFMRPSFDFVRMVAAEMVSEFRRTVTVEAQNRSP